ncbi:hypothetical protein Tco_1063144, partial [Tanacetum coccineum]
MNGIGELRAISSHVLRASGVQIPQDNLGNLRSTEEEEEDGVIEVLDPRDVPGSVLLEITDFAIFDLLLERLVLSTLDFDLLDLVNRLTPVEVDTKLLVVYLLFVWEEHNCFWDLLDDKTGSTNLSIFFLLIGMTESKFSL